MTNNIRFFYLEKSRLRWTHLRWVRLLFLPLVVLFSNFANATPQTSELDLSGTQGKVVYVDFWASWCTPCMASFPYMNQLKAAFPEKDFKIILVNLDHDKAKADRFLRGVKAPVASLYDPKGKIASAYKVSSMPTSIIIDRHGKIRYVHDGFHPEKTDEYTYHIEELIYEK